MDKFNFIKNKHWFLIFSGLLVFFGWLSIFVFFGWKWGIDFTGGTSWQIEFLQQDVGRQDLSKFLKDEIRLDEFMITPQLENKSYIIRAKAIAEPEHQRILTEFQNKFGNVEEGQFASIGPSIGKELKSKALLAFIFVLVGISLYVAYAFRKASYPVKSWKYGIVTLICLFHDVSIPIGLFAILSKLLGIEADTNFVVAILVVLGFSVHDTIVVFDRIRENLRLSNDSQKEFDVIVNSSVHQTLARSINTSLTLALVLVAMLILGPSSLFYFVLVILTGTIFGTYSSICVASPLLVLWRKQKSF